MHQALYPMLACSITACLAGACGLLHVDAIHDRRIGTIFTAIFASITTMGASGAIVGLLL